MILTLVLLFVTAIVLAAVLAPLWQRSASKAARGHYDRAIYRDQLKEIEREFPTDFAFISGHETAIAPTQGYLGTHGYLAEDPELDGIFIASGNGIKRGVSLPRVANLDVAPTIARLLGVKLPEVEGRVLAEILN